nr:hypothetical protein 1634Bnrm1_p102 [Cryptomonas sp.]
MLIKVMKKNHTLFVNSKKFLYNGMPIILDKRNFIIYTKKNILYYNIPKKKSLVPIFIRSKNFFSKTDILLLHVLPYLNSIVIFDSNKNLRIYCSVSFKLLRNFFFNLYIIYLKKDPFLDNIIYIIQSDYVSYNVSLGSKKHLFFSIVNLDECKTIKLIELKGLWFTENSIQYIEKKKILILIDNDSIVFLDFDWEIKKIFQKKFVHKVEICSISPYLNSLMVGDRRGFLTIYEFKTLEYFETKCLYLNKEVFFYFKKIKSWFLHYSVSSLFRSDENTIVINLFGVPKILYLNFIFLKKKYFRIICRKKFYISNIIGLFGFTKLLISSTDCVIFFNKYDQKINLSKIRILNFVDSFIAEKNNLMNTKIFRLKIFPCLFLSNSSFLLIGPNNIINYFEMEKDSFEFNQFFSNRRIIEKHPEKKAQSFECDAMGRNVYLLFRSFMFRKIISKKFTPTFTMSIDFSRLHISFFNQINDLWNFSISRNGNLIAVLHNNFHVDILGTNSFTSKNIAKASFSLNKKISAFSFSNDGFLIILITSDVLILWQFYPNNKKIKSISLDVKTSVNFLKILSGKGNKAIICTLDEILLFNIETFTLIWKFQIKVLDLAVDKWSDKFIIKAKYISIDYNRIMETVVVFEATCPVPLLSFDPILLFGTNVISFCFSYFHNNNNKKSLVCLDSFLTFHKLFY